MLYHQYLYIKIVKTISQLGNPSKVEFIEEFVSVEDNSYKWVSIKLWYYYVKICYSEN